MNIHDIEEKFKEYVTLDRYQPVERIVYGVVTIVLTAVIVAIVALVVRSASPIR